MMNKIYLILLFFLYSVSNYAQYTGNIKFLNMHGQVFYYYFSPGSVGHSAEIMVQHTTDVCMQNVRDYFNLSKLPKKSIFVIEYNADWTQYAIVTRSFDDQNGNTFGLKSYMPNYEWMPVVSRLDIKIAETAKKYYSENHSERNWEREYLVDDFGEEIRSAPYIRTQLKMNHCMGQQKEGLDETVFITVDAKNGLCFSTTGMFGSNFGIDPKILIKYENGKVQQFECQEYDGRLYVLGEDLKYLINIMDNGNYTLAIVAGGIQTSKHRYIKRVFDETAGLIQAIGHLQTAYD